MRSVKDPIESPPQNRRLYPRLLQSLLTDRICHPEPGRLPSDGEGSSCAPGRFFDGGRFVRTRSDQNDDLAAALRPPNLP